MKKALVGNTHVVAGGADDVPALFALLEEQGVELQGNPDVYVRTYKHFGIDDARELRERATLRALGERRVFVIVAADINREAQNALLKTIEEPMANALFFFLLPSPETLLPTFRSRAQTLLLKKSTAHEEVVDAEQFLSAPPQKRLDLLKPLLEKGEDDKRDLGAMLAFLSSLERALGIDSPSVAKAMEGKREGIESVYRARKYITDKGALVKPLLEQVALLVPKV